MAACSRADGPALDLNGPYIKVTSWPGLWWNLNVQLTYWPFNTSNHLDIAENYIKLIDDFGGEVPQSREELITLPGVGRKTANVVQSMAFGIPTMAVDTHVFRIGNRLKLAPGKTPDDVEDILMKRIPEEYLYHAHHWLILHGRYCCKARKPECDKCVIADICKSKEKTCDIPAALVELPAQPF